MKPWNDIELHINLKKEFKNITSKEKQYTIPIFIPHNGCKNKCVFCNQVKISGKDAQPTTNQVDNIITEHLDYLKESKDYKIEIAFFGGSFTGLDINLQEEYLKVAYKYVVMGKVNSIRLSTRPDYINVKILKMLKKYKVKTIELGVQSMDDEILEKSKRGHKSIDVIRSSRLIKLFKINLGIQIMLGLPGSTFENECSTINQVIKINPSQLRIYPVYVIYPSELYDMYISGDYVPLSLDEAENRTSEIIKRCIETDIKIIRIGLQRTEIITQSNKKIIGPVCDNFAEYALSKIAREKLEEKIKEISFDNTKKNRLKIYVDKRYISYVSAPHRKNIKYFEEKYGIYLKIIGE